MGRSCRMREGCRRAWPTPVTGARRDTHDPHRYVPRGEAGDARRTTGSSDVGSTMSRDNRRPPSVRRSQLRPPPRTVQRSQLPRRRRGSAWPWGATERESVNQPVNQPVSRSVNQSSWACVCAGGGPRGWLPRAAECVRASIALLRTTATATTIITITTAIITTIAATVITVPSANRRLRVSVLDLACLTCQQRGNLLATIPETADDLVSARLLGLSGQRPSLPPPR